MSDKPTNPLCQWCGGTQVVPTWPDGDPLPCAKCCPTPLSPIALDQEVGLDFEAAKKTLLGAEWEFPKRVKDNLNAQLRTLVARVAQEEREKVAEKMRECWGEAFNCGIAAGHDLSSRSERDTEKQWQQSNAKDWLDSFLRGTP